MIKDKIIIQKKLHNKTLTTSQQEATLKQIKRSIATLQTRTNNLPNITPNKNLPIADKQQTIVNLLKSNQVIIVCGETGSGKTTQLPQICLQAGYGLKGKIAHTQPRRLAARTVAKRIAEELKQTIGQAVGFKIRFQDSSNNASYIKLMTDGILLNEIHNDPLLLQYDTIIIDEAHERSLNIDFLLGYLKKLTVKRKDVKIIITSATIDPKSFSTFFNNAPVVMVKGRTYPVEILYRDYSLQQDDNNQPEDYLQKNVHLAIEECFLVGDGDILIFFATEKDIHETKKQLSKIYEHDGRLEILPLYSRLSQKEQNLIFFPKSKKRIILTTNVAETSVTVPRIDFVIDTGLVRISRYSVRSKIQRLPIEKVSQASAKQRAGRCGRLNPGTVIRLYSDVDFDSRDEFTEPEILRTNLASVILQMSALNLGDIEQYPFINPPELQQINDGYRLLYEISAFNKQNTITKVGRQLSRFPIDPRCAKMLITASQTACLTELLIIVSAISVADPKERPHDNKQVADLAHKTFQDKQSDFIGYINLYNHIVKNKKELTQNKFRKWCKRQFLSYQRCIEWLDIHKQLLSTCQQLKLSCNQKEANYQTIHQAIISGIATHIAIKDEKFDYLGTRNRKMRIFPGSALFKKPPKTIVALEIAETSSVFARTVAKIELSWVEPYVEHLISKTYGQPIWKKKPGLVSAKQTSNLYGLDISNNKRVNYCTIDPTISHQLFIRHALVYDEWTTRAQFLKHNRSLITKLTELEHKARKRDILVTDEWLESFYAKHLPNTICTGAGLEKWAKQLNQQTSKALYLTKEQLIQNQQGLSFDEQYPSTINFDGITLPLHYQFHPGNQHDGVTLHIPIELLAQLPNSLTQWLVPGLIEDKCINILKGLSKPLRKQLVPIPNLVKRFLASTPCPNNNTLDDLFKCLSQFILANLQLTINPQILKDIVLEPYYLMGFQIINDDNSLGVFSKNLAQLKTQFQQKQHANKVKKVLSQQDIQKWDFGDIEEFVTLKRNDYTIKAYPALTLENNLLQIQTFTDANLAKENHQEGLIELIKRAIKKQINYSERNLPEIEKTCLLLNKTQSCQSLKTDLINNAIRHYFFNNNLTVKKQSDFEKVMQQPTQGFQQYLNDYCLLLNKVLTKRQTALAPISKNIDLGWIETANDIKDQDHHLIVKGFVKQLSPTQLKQFNRYYQAIAVRLTSLQHNPEKDRAQRVQCSAIWQQSKTLLAQQHTNAIQKRAIESIKWKMEELRISLFAQQIKTTEKISVKRMEKLLNEYQTL